MQPAEKEIYIIKGAMSVYLSVCHVITWEQVKGFSLNPMVVDSGNSQEGLWHKKYKKDGLCMGTWAHVVKLQMPTCDAGSPRTEGRI